MSHPPLIHRIHPRQWLITVGGITMLLVQGAVSPGHGRQLLLFILLWLLPTLLWSMWLRGPFVERFLGGAGLAMLIPVLLALAASYLPGPLPPLFLKAVALGSLVAPLAATLVYRYPTGDRDSTLHWPSAASRALVLVIFLTLTLRLVNIDYKEFQGDEGVIMVRAAQALAGDELAMLRHQKGPVEILVPLLPWGLGESLNELWARAAFAWAGSLAILPVVAVGTRLTDWRGGLLAGLLYAIGGFGIAFSRIVQYQSFVVLWSLLGLLFAARYLRGGFGIDLIATVVFLAAGLLAHYDAVLFAPAIGWLIFARWRRKKGRYFVHAVAAMLCAAAVLALFYLPYFANPTFRGTESYLINDRIGGSLFSWSAPLVWRMATFYNSTYYVLLLLFLAIVGVFLVVWREGRGAIILFALVPLFFYSLVVADPRTHIYTAFPGLALLAGPGAHALWRERYRAGFLRWPGLATLALLFCLSLWYVLLLFVDVTPERQRTWDENRPPLFPTTWSEPPQYGLFGFPHQAGWRLAPALVKELPYASNEEAEITDWYMAQAARTHCSDYQTFLLAARAQDAIPFDPTQADEDDLEAVVTVNGRAGLEIFQRDADGRVASYEATEVELWRTPREIVPPDRHGTVRIDKTLGENLKLLGYTLEQAVVEPGETFEIVLYWQALAPVDRNYQVFVHLFWGTMWAQSDGAPDCAMQPTSGWEPGQIVRDAHRITVSTETPARDIPLTVGMYDLLTSDRLPVPETGKDAIHLTDIRVMRPEP